MLIDKMSPESELELREKFGYSDEDIDLVKKSRDYANQAWLYSKMADDLRAKAAHAAWHRMHPEGLGKK